MCTVADFLTTYADLETGYMPFTFPLPRREMHRCKQSVLHLKDRKPRAAQGVAQVWPVGFEVQGGQREPMLEVIHGRVELLFFFCDPPSPKYN